MKRWDLGQVAGILANVGVIVGILLLVFELNQNRLATEAQTRNAIADTLVHLLSVQASTPELAEVDTKRRAGEPLTAAETRMDSLITSAFWRWSENVHYQYRNGLYDEGEYAVQRSVFSRTLNSNDARRDRWCRTRDTFSDAFRREVDGWLNDSCDE